MTAISWKYNTDGSWSNAANWSGGALPGAADDVTLATLSYHTITHSSGSDQIHSLTATTDSLAVTGGTLSISGTASFAKNLTVSTGTLSLGTSGSVAGTFTGTSGQILLGTGTALTLSGTSNFGTTNVSYGTEIDGPGTLSTLGTTNIAASYYDGMVLGNGITWNNQATVNDAGGIYLGDGAGLGATLINAAGVAFNLTTDSANIVNGYYYNTHGQQVYGTSTFSNAGTVGKTGGTGTSHIYSVFTNTGVVSAATGTLEFDGGGNFGGTLSGVGQIAFGGGTATIASGAGLTVTGLLFDGAAATVTGAWSDTGTATLTNGSLTLDGSTDSIATFSQYGTSSDHLNLAGSTLSVGNAFLGSGYLEGSGTLTVAGTTTLSGWNNYTYYLGSGVTLANTGTINQAYYTYVDYLSGAGFTILNKAGATYNVTGDFSLGANNNNGIGSTFTNTGTFAKSGGTGTTQVISAFNSTGTVNAATGTIEFDGGGTIGGSLTGTGTVAFASNTETLAAGIALKATEILFDGATVTLGGNETYTTQQMAETSGRILLNGHTLAETSAFLGGGDITGPGTLTTAGTTTFSGNNSSGILYLGGGVSVVNSGVINQNYYMYVDYLTGAGFSVTNKVGATYNITGNFNIGGNNSNGIGSTFTNSGTFAKVAGTATTQVISAFTSTGTITSTIGNLEFDNGGTIGGKLTGAGTISFAGGNVALGAGVAISVANLTLDGANLTLGANLNLGTTIFTQNAAGTLSLGGFNLAVAGADFAYGFVNGPGTLTTSGTTTIGNSYYLQLGGGLALVNSGTVNQDYYVYDNYTSGAGFNATNQAGATWNITGDFGIGGNNNNGVTSGFTNAGIFAKTGGTNTSQVISAFTNTGTITGASGNLEFDGGGTLGGTLNGAASISLASSITLSAGVSLKVATLNIYNGGSVTLAANTSYTGTFNFSSGALYLGANTLTLTAPNLSNGTIDGPGTLSLNGTTALGAGSFYFGGQATINNNGSVNQNGYVYVSYQSGAGFTVNNLAGATWNLTNTYYLGGNNYNGTSSTFNNAGTFTLTGGTSYSLIYSVFNNTGTVSAATGEIAFESGGTFNGTLGGVGLISFQNNSYNLGSLTETATASTEFYQSTINLTAGLTFNGTLLANGSSSTVNLAGQQFTLGTLTLAHAGTALYFEQGGTFTTTGPGSIVDWYSNGVMISMGGGSTWVNSGTMLNGGVVQLGDNNFFNGSSAGTLVNQAGANFDFTSDDAAIHQGSYTNSNGTNVASSAIVINAGTLAKTGGTGTSHIYGTLTSTGTLATTTGTLELDNGGTISGMIADGSSIAFSGGPFSFGALTVGGGAAVSSSVRIDATGGLTLGDTSSTAATFANSSLFELDGNVGIRAGGTAASSFVNTASGTIAKISGTGRSLVDAGLLNSGTVLVSAGTLDLAGSVTGTGVLDIGAAATLELGASVVATQAIDYTAATGTLLVDSIAGAVQTISGLTVGDVVDLAGTTATKASVNASDQLVISNGSTVVAKLQLAGSYLSDTFTVATDGNGGSLITLTKATTAWQGGTADWFGANAWTNGPPNAQTDATIAQTGTYTVSLASNETAYASTLAFNAASATFNLYGRLNISKSFTMTAGSLALSGGTIIGGTLAVAAGAAFTFSNGASLTNVAYQGTMDLSENYANVTLIGAGSISGSAGHGAGTINLTGYDSTLYVDDYQTLTNAALSIGNNSYYATLRSYDTTGQGAILTLGSTLAITHTGIYATISDGGNDYDAVYNAGKITAGLSGGTFTVTGNDFENDGTVAISNGDLFSIQSGTFANTGTMTVSGATLALYGVIQNTGSITATNSVLNIHSSITGSFLTAIASGGDTLNLSGTLDEGNGTLSVGTGAKIVGLSLSGEILNATIKPTAGAFTFLNGSTLDNVTYLGTMSVGSGVAVTLDDTLKGATIADSGGGILFGSNVILNGDTYQGTMSLLSGNSASVTGGLTLTGPGGTGAGAINATAGASDSVLYFLDNETLSNVTITSGGGSGGTLGLFLDPIVPTVGTLTLAASTTFHVLANTTAGFLSVNPSTGLASNDKIVNNGQITLDAGATFLGSDGSLGSVTNGGTISLGAGAVWTAPPGTLTSASFSNTAAGLIALSSNATFTTNGGTTTNAGKITLGTGALANIEGGYAQTGTVTVAAGGSFNIFGTTTLASVAAISGAGTLGIDGLLNLGGGTFDMAASGRIANVMIGGDLKGGTFLNDAGNVTFGTLATLDGMTWKGELDVGAGSTVQILNGLTLQTSSGGTPGIVGLTGGGTLDYVAGASLNNITINSSSPSAGLSSPGLTDSLDIGTAGGTLALGANAIVNANAGAMTFADTAGGGVLVNNGQINVTAGALWLDSSFISMTNNSTITLASNTEFDPTPSSTGSSNFTNAGLVTLTGLDNFDVSGNGASSGTITIGAGSEVSFGGNFTNSGKITMSHSGSLTAGGTLTNSGMITASGSSSDYVAGTAAAGSAFNAGTLTGGVWSVSTASTLTLDFGSSLTTIAADVIISGANSVLRSVGTTIARVESTLATIASGGTLALLSNRSYSTSLSLTDSGTVQLQGGTLSAAGLTVSSGGLLTGSGTVANAVSNAGTIDASGGTLTLSAATTGAGLLQIEAGSELVLGVANAETVLFNSGSSELGLTKPTTFTGTLSGFGAGDSLFLGSTNGTAASISGTSLTVTLSGGTTEIFKLATSQTAKTLTVTSDGSGDTIVTYPGGQVHKAPVTGSTPAMQFIAAPSVTPAEALAASPTVLPDFATLAHAVAATSAAATVVTMKTDTETASSWMGQLHAGTDHHGLLMLSGRE